jgi:hypothetical protein
MMYSFAEDQPGSKIRSNDLCGFFGVLLVDVQRTYQITPTLGSPPSRRLLARLSLSTNTFAQYLTTDFRERSRGPATSPKDRLPQFSKYRDSFDPDQPQHYAEDVPSAQV